MATDKCVKVKGCSCGCAKPRRKRVAKKKTGAKMTAPIVPQVINITQPNRIPQLPFTPIIPPRTYMAPINTPNLVPNANANAIIPPPKPAKYSRVVKPAVVIPSAPLVQPLSRYASKLVGMASKPVSALTDVGTKPVKEKKKSLIASDVERLDLSKSIDMSKPISTQLKERKSLVVSQPSAPTLLSPDLNIRGALEKPTQSLNKKELKPQPSPLTEKGEGRKLTEKQFPFIEPAPLSRPAMLGLIKEGQLVRHVKESGGPRVGAGRPIEPAPLSRPAMLGLIKEGQLVRHVKESGGPRVGAGRPIKEPIERALPYDFLK